MCPPNPCPFPYIYIFLHYICFLKTYSELSIRWEVLQIFALKCLKSCWIISKKASSELYRIVLKSQKLKYFSKQLLIQIHLSVTDTHMLYMLWLWIPSWALGYLGWLTSFCLQWCWPIFFQVHHRILSHYLSLKPEKIWPDFLKITSSNWE